MSFRKPIIVCGILLLWALLPAQESPEIFRISNNEQDDRGLRLHQSGDTIWIGWLSGGDSPDDENIIQIAPFVGDSLPQVVPLTSFSPYLIRHWSSIDLTMDDAGALNVLSFQSDMNYSNPYNPVISKLIDTSFVSEEVPAPYWCCLNNSGSFIGSDQQPTLAITGHEDLWLLKMEESNWDTMATFSDNAFYGYGFWPGVQSLTSTNGQSWVLAAFSMSFTGNYWDPITLFCFSDSVLTDHVIDGSGIEFNPFPYLLGSDFNDNLYVTYEWVPWESEDVHVRAAVYAPVDTGNGVIPLLQHEWDIQFTPEVISKGKSPVTMAWDWAHLIYMKSWDDSTWYKTVSADITGYGLSSAQVTDLVVDDSGYVWVGFSAIDSSSQRDVFLLKVLPNTEVDSSMSIKHENVVNTIPESLVLYQSYPNPFNPATTILFYLTETGDVELVIYDILGRKVEELVSGRVDRGEHEVIWNASELSSGIYFCRLESGNVTQTRKLLLLK